jgi:hypothetical protein
LIINFTEKLRSKLHLPDLDPAEFSPAPYRVWYAKVFTAQRVQYILTANAASMFSVEVYGRGMCRLAWCARGINP